MKWWDWDSEEVLETNNVEVVWSDKLINGLDEVEDDPDGGSWSLLWKPGVINLGHFGKDDEKIARIGAALFVTLWLKGVPVYIASRLAGDYVYLEWDSKRLRKNRFIHGAGI